MGSEPMDAETQFADAGPATTERAMQGASAREPRRVSARRVKLLAHTLENDVIPRLVLSRSPTPAPAYIDRVASPGPTADDVSTMTGLVQQGDLEGALDYIGGLCASGMALERVYLNLLAPVARRLGEMWETDQADFTSVTVGLCCLQQLVLTHGGGFRPRDGRPHAERRVLLAPCPGEQHSFGLLMVGEFFRRQGWDVTSGTGATGRELTALVRKDWFALVGLSLSVEERLDTLAALVRDLRRASRNPALGVMVGGQVFVQQPDLAVLVGADATAADGQQAALKAEALLALLSRDIVV